MQDLCISAQGYVHMLKIFFLFNVKIEQHTSVWRHNAVYTGGYKIEVPII
ncbi:Hypothetical protein AKI40_0631 [Enterobacter sp. FY-07]|nr:Hypothetical protein AKI40_0631 [Enterobacter sp. FY-07]